MFTTCQLSLVNAQHGGRCKAALNQFHSCECKSAVMIRFAKKLLKRQGILRNF